MRSLEGFPEWCDNYMDNDMTLSRSYDAHTDKPMPLVKQERISSLISRLQDLKDANGDLPIVLTNEDGLAVLEELLDLRIYPDSLKEIDGPILLVSI